MMPKMSAEQLPELVDGGLVHLYRRRESDVAELWEAIHASAAELGGFLSWAAHGPPSMQDLEQRIVDVDEKFESGAEFEFVLRESTTGDLVGEAGGEFRNERTVELGYWVRTDRTGRGYATSAAAALTGAVFDAFSRVERVELRMDKGNTRSEAVARHLGWPLLGEERFDSEPFGGQTGEGYIFGVTREHWDR
jgi:ribosomal-protein-serine acetyltransferase